MHTQVCLTITRERGKNITRIMWMELDKGKNVSWLSLNAETQFGDDMRHITLCFCWIFHFRKLLSMPNHSILFVIITDSQQLFEFMLWIIKRNWSAVAIVYIFVIRMRWQCLRALLTYTLHIFAHTYTKLPLIESLSWLIWFFLVVVKLMDSMSTNNHGDLSFVDHYNYSTNKH